MERSLSKKFKKIVSIASALVSLSACIPQKSAAMKNIAKQSAEYTTMVLTSALISYVFLANTVLKNAPLPAILKGKARRDYEEEREKENYIKDATNYLLGDNAEAYMRMYSNLNP